jgi:hypothetical protein
MRDRTTAWNDRCQQGALTNSAPVDGPLTGNPKQSRELPSFVNVSTGFAEDNLIGGRGNSPQVPCMYMYIVDVVDLLTSRRLIEEFQRVALSTKNTVASTPVDVPGKGQSKRGLTDEIARIPRSCRRYPGVALRRARRGTTGPYGGVGGGEGPATIRSPALRGKTPWRVVSTMRQRPGARAGSLDGPHDGLVARPTTRVPGVAALPTHFGCTRISGKGPGVRNSGVRARGRLVRARHGNGRGVASRGEGQAVAHDATAGSPGAPQ